MYLSFALNYFFVENYVIYIIQLFYLRLDSGKVYNYLSIPTQEIKTSTTI